MVLQIETEGEHLLVDSKNEKKFGLSLAVVVDRAAKHRDRGGLLAGKSFWWTPKVMGDLDQIKKLVESAGGTVSRASLFTLAFLVSGRGADMQSSELIMAGEQITKGFPKASLITESRDSRFLISDVADIDKWRPVRICPRLPSLAPKLLQLTSFFFPLCLCASQLEDKGVKVYDRELILSALLHQKVSLSIVQHLIVSLCSY